MNPIAGMGGNVGRSKGTDGEMIAQARRQCTTGHAAACRHLPGRDLTPQRHCMVGASRGKMRADFLTALSLPFTLIDGSPDPEGETSANDTPGRHRWAEAGADLRWCQQVKNEHPRATSTTPLRRETGRCRARRCRGVQQRVRTPAHALRRRWWTLLSEGTTSRRSGT